MRLSAPKALIFTLCFIVGVFTIVCHFVNVPLVGSFVRANEFWFLGGSFVLLTLGNIFRGL